MATINDAMAMWGSSGTWPPPAVGGITWATAYTDGTVAVVGANLEIAVTAVGFYETDLEVDDDPGGSQSVLDWTGCTAEFGIQLDDVVSENLATGDIIQIVCTWPSTDFQNLFWTIGETNVGDLDINGDPVGAGDFIFQSQGPWEATNIDSDGLVFHPADHWGIRIAHDAGTNRFSLWRNVNNGGWSMIDDGDASGYNMNRRFLISAFRGEDRAPWTIVLDWGASGPGLFMTASRVD